MSWQACIFLNPFEFRAFHYRTALDLYLDGYKKFKAELAPVVLENETQQYHPLGDAIDAAIAQQKEKS